MSKVINSVKSIFSSVVEIPPGPSTSKGDVFNVSTDGSVTTSSSVEFPSTSDSVSQDARPTCSVSKIKIRRQYYSRDHYSIKLLYNRAPYGVPIGTKCLSLYEMKVIEKYTINGEGEEANVELINKEKWTSEEARKYMRSTFLTKKRLFDEEVRVFVPRGYEYLYLLRKVSEDILWSEEFLPEHESYYFSEGMPIKIDDTSSSDVEKVYPLMRSYPRLTTDHTMPIELFGSPEPGIEGKPCCKGRYDNLDPLAFNDANSINWPSIPRKVEFIGAFEPRLESEDGIAACTSCIVTEYKKMNPIVDTLPKAYPNMDCKTLILAPHYSGKTTAAALLRNYGYAVFETNRTQDMHIYRNMLRDSLLFTSNVDVVQKVSFEHCYVIIPEEKVYNTRRSTRLKFSKRTRLKIKKYKDYVKSIADIKSPNVEIIRTNLPMTSLVKPYR